MKIPVLLLIFVIGACEIYISLPISFSEQRERARDTKYLKAEICLVNNVRRRRGRTKNMIKVCKSCGKEFQNFTEGVLYSSHAIGVLEFCSDDCSKNYFNSGMK